MSARALLEKAAAAGEGEPLARGLQFLCFNANIDRQFEFVQQQWCNNPKFAGQNSDADPLLGMRQPPSEIGVDAPGFTIQSDVKTGLCARVANLQRFVRVVGSGYFLMPSIPAVRLLRNVAQSSSRAAAELESVPPDEQLHIDSLIDVLREKMKRDYAGGETLRDAHPKMHGCVRALFKIEPELEPSLRVGLLAEPRTYKAWVRFSNASHKVSPDGKPDIRGAAIKLLDVPGPKLLEGDEDCKTHDLILISTDTFVTKDVAEFDGLMRALVGGGLDLLRFFASHPRAAWNLLASRDRHSSPLEVRYFSVAPYLLGSRAVKYSLAPSEPARSTIPRDAGPDYLRDVLKARLAERAVSFDFSIQLREDASKLPIEDPGVPWRGRGAPFRKVATLEILQQRFDTAEQRSFGENLSFNPWRCLPEHRPLGGISRARRQVYRTLSAFRHDRNSAPRDEPTPW